MAKRLALLIDEEGSPWREFLKEFFEDTPTELQIFHKASLANSFFDRTHVDIVFINESMLSLTLTQKLKVSRQSNAEFRIFGVNQRIGDSSSLIFDARHQNPPSLSDFQKDIVRYLYLPETISVLIMDDEKETGTVFRDFLSGRIRPAFEVEHVLNGQEGLKAIEEKRPHVIILDVKMPVMDGRQVYRILREKKWDIPVIVFFDAVFDEDLIEIYKYGRPAIVEKGTPLSSMPEMMTLIKKMVFFG